jgi:hypothetical protein
VKGTWQTTDGGSGLGVAVAAIAMAVVIGSVAAPVIAVADALARAVLITAAVIVGLAGLGLLALLGHRLRYRRPGGTTRASFLGTVQPRPTQALPAAPPTSAALPPPARREVHLHFHGVTADDVAEILGRVNHDDA